MARVEFTDDAREDIRDLDGSARKIVLQALNKLKDQPDQRGQPLGSTAKGNLTGFRKLVIGDRDYRAVYRVTDDGDVVVVIVVAKRADQECYELALARLELTDAPHIRQMAGRLREIFE